MDQSVIQRRKQWIGLKAPPAVAYAALLLVMSVDPACVMAGTTCATPTGSVPCIPGPVRKAVTLPAPAAAPSRAAAAKIRQQQVAAQRQQQVTGQRQELLKQRQNQVTKQRAAIRSGLTPKGPKS